VQKPVNPIVSADLTFNSRSSIYKHSCGIRPYLSIKNSYILVPGFEHLTSAEISPPSKCLKKE
jgi:hypothetical protein